jgi:hypothetical protein
MESMQGQTAELNYQLREATERVELLTEELGEVRREQHARSSGTSHSADDAARILALTEARYEAKLGELQNRVHASERERNDGESAWSRKLDEKTRELDALRRQMDASTDIEFRHQAALAQIHEENERLRQEMLSHRSDVTNLRLVADQAAEAEVCDFHCPHADEGVSLIPIAVYRHRRGGTSKCEGHCARTAARGVTQPRSPTEDQ